MTKRRVFIFALLASLLVHCFILYLLAVLKVPSKGEEGKQEVMEVVLPDQMGWRIADIAKPAVEKKPQKARFLGMYDSSVDEEKVASGFARPPGRPTSRGGLGGEKAKELSRRPPNKTLSDNYEFVPGDSSKKEKIVAMREPLTPPVRETGLRSDLGDDLASHVPEDYFPDYKRGGRTYLNVLKYRGVEYFVMLKRIFKMTWDPVPALRKHIMANEVSRGTVQVVLGVSVDERGELAELFVFRSSGLELYDKEAIRAIRSSAPFSKPPEKLLKEGLLHMSWTFVVYM